MSDWPKPLCETLSEPVKPDWAVPIEQWLKPYTKGVYYLWRGEALVYIGKSVNISMRIKQHADVSKCRFTHFTWIDLSFSWPKDASDEQINESLELFEAIEIDRFRPEGNAILNIALLRSDLTDSNAPA